MHVFSILRFRRLPAVVAGLMGAMSVSTLFAGAQLIGLGHLPGLDGADAIGGISRDGSTVVGRVGLPSTQYAARWTAGAG